jgi:hypothetical protein
MTKARIVKMEYRELKKYVQLHKKTLSTAPQNITSSARFWNSKFTQFKRKLNREGIKSDGYRFYFVRFDMECIAKGNEYTQKLRKDNISTQMSVAIVPGKETKYEMMKDVLNPDKKTIWVLFPGGENSGLCPPDCEVPGNSL